MKKTTSGWTTEFNHKDNTMIHFFENNVVVTTNMNFGITTTLKESEVIDSFPLDDIRTIEQYTAFLFKICAMANG